MRLRKKLDLWLWFIVTLLPILIGVVCFIKSGDSADFLALINEFKFDFVYDCFSSIGDVTTFQFNSTLISLVSYFMSVELIHVLYDFLVMLPRLCHDIFGRITE